MASEVNPNIEICQLFIHGSDETTEVYARLIAASPDLYESLEMLVDAIRSGEQQKIDGAKLCSSRALARARGEIK